MFESTGECIVNMIKIRRNTHPLFRSFGLSNVDDLSPITRSTLAVEVARWFPGNRVKSLEMSRNERGEFSYNVQVEGK